MDFINGQLPSVWQYAVQPVIANLYLLIVCVDYEPQNILCMEIRGGEENSSCLGLAVAFDKLGGVR